MNSTHHPQNGGTYSDKLHENHLLELVVEGEFSPRTTQEIVQRVRQRQNESGLLSGLLLDLRRSAPFSIVRASNLVDTLSRIVTPVAVIFGWQQQQELASLLHYTLPNRDAIAYFTDASEAWSYLQKHLDE